MITSPDDGLVRTHEDAQALLRYAVPGARVDFARPVLRDISQNNTERSMSYRIVVKRLGFEDVCALGPYSLPAIGDMLRSSAVKQVAEATGERP